MEQPKIKLNNLFSVLVAQFSIPNWSELKSDIMNALPKEKYNNDNAIFSDYWDNLESDEKPDYADLVMHSVMGALSQCAMSPDIDLIDMWYQKQYKGQYHTVHTHGNTGCSAILFVDFNDKIHKSTRFYNPYPNAILGGHLEDTTIDVKEGDLLVFPSNVLHDSMVNNYDIPRTIISFNFTTRHDRILQRYKLQSPDDNK